MKSSIEIEYFLLASELADAEAEEPDGEAELPFELLSFEEQAAKENIRESESAGIAAFLILNVAIVHPLFQ
ncbi:hypothetical protein [Cohnella fermenti]|uniref:hypothetical protein n=1 Tax=Cohnella fermenti TaxID=2565925 RepID=UPI001454CA4B|nr:hypothetical protein [Cohnella fermenti]